MRTKLISQSLTHHMAEVTTLRAARLQHESPSHQLAKKTCTVKPSSTHRLNQQQESGAVSACGAHLSQNYAPDSLLNGFSLFCRQDVKLVDRPFISGDRGDKELGSRPVSASKQSPGQSKLLTAVAALQQSGFDPLKQHRSGLAAL